MTFFAVFLGWSVYTEGADNLLMHRRELAAVLVSVSMLMVITPEYIIGRSCLEEAYVSKLPEDLLQYGEQLQKAFEVFAAKRGLTENNLLSDLPRPDQPEAIGRGSSLGVVNEHHGGKLVPLPGLLQ